MPRRTAIDITALVQGARAAIQELDPELARDATFEASLFDAIEKESALFRVQIVCRPDRLESRRGFWVHAGEDGVDAQIINKEKTSSVMPGKIHTLKSACERTGVDPESANRIIYALMLYFLNPSLYSEYPRVQKRMEWIKAWPPISDDGEWMSHLDK